MILPIKIRYPISPNGRYMEEFTELCVPDDSTIQCIDIVINDNSEFTENVKDVNTWGGSMFDNGFKPMAISFTTIEERDNYGS